MHQMSFGGRAPLGRAGGALALPDPLVVAGKEVDIRKGGERRGERNEGVKRKEAGKGAGAYS